MASPPATWSVTACLSYRGGLEIRAAAENVLPGWGHGGERLSFLLRLRRRLCIAVTSQCGCPPAPSEPGKKPRVLKLLRFLRSRLARATPRIPSVLRRKKPMRAAAGVATPGPRTPANPSILDRALMRPAMTIALCFLAATSLAVLRIMAGFMIPSASCTSWRCFLVKKFVRILGAPLFEWLSRISLKLIKFLDPPVELSRKWLFNK